MAAANAAASPTTALPCPGRWPHGRGPRWRACGWGWTKRFLTTDRVRLDASGVWLEGRASDAINVAGRKISPSVIEEKLLALPGVRHCVVFGIRSADAARVDEIVACLNLSGDGTMDEVRQASARSLPATEQPRHWRSCPDLEPDARGKISRAAWRKRWLEAPAGSAVRPAGI